MHAVVTGANGFIGRHLTERLLRHGWRVSVVTRRDARPGTEKLPVDLGAGEAHLAAVLGGADVVFHLAAIAHEAVARADAGQLHAINVDAARRLLAAADRAGVAHLVALSSIKVLGDVSSRPLRPADPYRPAGAYARSKMAAERVLLGAATATTGVTVVRPPLVYGPGVGGNFKSLLQWVARGVPLPLAGASQPRSMVSVGNLCDLLLRVVERGGSGIFHVADATDRSVAELVGWIAGALGRPDRSWRVAPGLLRAAARASGQLPLYARLFEPLQVDQRETLEQLCWRPPADGDAELERTVRWFRQLH